MRDNCAQVKSGRKQQIEIDWMIDLKARESLRSVRKYRVIAHCQVVSTNGSL